MQVYKITPKIAYSYGCALVAADSKEQAIETYRNKDEFTDWNYDFLNCECDIVEKLHYYCESATIILDEIGSE